MSKYRFLYVFVNKNFVYVYVAALVNDQHLWVCMGIAIA